MVTDMFAERLVTDGVSEACRHVPCRGVFISSSLVFGFLIDV